MAYTHKYYKVLFITVSLLLMLNLNASAQKDFTVVQLTDPQFGFFSENKTFEKETELYTEAVRQINELKPAFVVITGDLVNNAKDTAQINEFKRITALIDDDIPVYLIPGNHDLGQNPTKEDFEFYFNNYGKGTDRFSVKHEGSAFIGINSVVIKSDKNQKEEKRQYRWLKRQLRKMKNSDNIVIFTHYPFFINDINEKETYSNQSIENRHKYFELFKKYGVDVVFAGHLHNNAEASYDGISMITTNAVGRPLGEARSGMRIITIHNGELSNEYKTLQ
jgi:3',5'-cyclic AMP phosphodiesterase CpdA